MPFFFILIGAALIVIGYRGTQKDFFALLKDDFSGPGNFFVFAMAIFLVGLVGYVPKLKGISNAFMGLIIVVMLLSNKGFFAKFSEQINTASNTPQDNSSSPFTLPSIPAIPGLK